MPQHVNPPAVCTDQNVVAPIITCVEGVKNLKKMQGIQVVQGQQAIVQYTLRDSNGDPVNLQPCLASGGSILLKMREEFHFNPSYPGFNIPCTPVDMVTNGVDGKVQCQLTLPSVSRPGIFRCEFGLLDVNGNLLFSNEIFLVVNRGQFAPQNNITPLGPPTVAEIRLHLRDSDPSDNLWLGVEEFDLAEIAACIEMPIHYFNEAPPPITQRFNTANFPGRYHYLEAIVGCLYKLAAKHYARVHLPYQQQQGLMVDDKNKAEQYAALSKESWENWKDWTRHKKVQLNAMAAVQTTGSPYWGTLWSNW